MYSIELLFMSQELLRSLVKGVTIQAVLHSIFTGSQAHQDCYSNARKGQSSWYKTATREAVQPSPSYGEFKNSGVISALLVLESSLHSAQLMNDKKEIT
jgi:hypothetical protein